MKFLFSLNDQKKFIKLFDVKEINMSVADIYLETFNQGYFIDKQELSKMMNEVDGDEAKAIYQILMDHYQINIDDEENRQIGEKYFLSHIKHCQNDDFASNPYYLSVKPNEISEGKYRLCYLSYRPFQLFSLDEIKVDDKYFEEYSPVGFFDEPYTYLALLENDTIWMSITPNEINSMKDATETVTGRVLVLGLGLGYFPYQIIQKENVKQAVVVENNPAIIKLFKKALWPFFNHRQKMDIVLKDAFVYLKEEAGKNRFDHVFVDIYHNAEEALWIYIRCLSYEPLFNKCHFHYWLEPSILALARRCLLTLFYEQYNHINIKYNKAENDTDRLINCMYQLLKDKTYYTFDEIHKALTDEKIKDLLKQISQNIFKQ